MKKRFFAGLGILALLLVMLTVSGCLEPTAEEAQVEQTKQIMGEVSRQVGMPEIKNFQEKKWQKLIMELRDRADLVTYAYMKNEYAGRFTYLGRAIGFGLPYSVQYTNPMRRLDMLETTVPQADPNGLYMPDNVSATWVMLINPDTGKPEPMYFEPNVVVVPFKLPKRLVEPWSLTSDY